MLGCQRHVDVFGDICQRAFRASSDWAHSEGHPHTEGAFTGTLVKVRGLRRNSGECKEILVNMACGFAFVTCLMFLGTFFAYSLLPLPFCGRVTNVRQTSPGLAKVS